MPCTVIAKGSYTSGQPEWNWQWPFEINTYCKASYKLWRSHLFLVDLGTISVNDFHGDMNIANRLSANVFKPLIPSSRKIKQLVIPFVYIEKKTEIFFGFISPHNYTEMSIWCYTRNQNSQPKLRITSWLLHRSDEVAGIE